MIDGWIDGYGWNAGTARSYVHMHISMYPVGRIRILDLDLSNTKTSERTLPIGAFDYIGTNHVADGPC